VGRLQSSPLMSTILRMNKPSSRLTASLLILTAFHFTESVASAQASSNGTAPKIGSLHVSGEKRFTAGQVIAAIGLRVGQVFDAKDLDAAAEKLGKSGVFQEVNYSYVPEGGQVAVEFNVQEAPRFRNCLLDNFVWVSDEELQARLKRDVPLYVGEAPETGEILDQIARSLEKLSAEKSVTSQVERRIQQNRIGDPDWSHLFTANGPKVEIQKVSFTGTLTVDPDELQHEAARMIGQDYSIARSSFFANAAFIPFYHERGYLRASVKPIAPRMLSHAEGSNQFVMEVVYSVTEGSVYHWTPGEWIGNHELAAADLEKLTDMKLESLANEKQIDGGWDAIRKAYGKKGYIDAKVAPEPVFDDQSRHVRYRVTISEGLQYLMGKFQISGVPQKIADRLQARWRLKAGDVFDASYPGEFTSKDAGPVLQGTMKRSLNFRVAIIPNREQHIVDVTFQVE
jgi:outer membrane protein assembly factor BamA